MREKSKKERAGQRKTEEEKRKQKEEIERQKTEQEWVETQRAKRKAEREVSHSCSSPFPMLMCPLSSHVS